jgi:hypothetical protein
MVALTPAHALASRGDEDAQLRAALTIQYDGPKGPAFDIAAIRASAGKARRTGSNLSLQLTTGKVIHLHDVDCGDTVATINTDCRHHYLAATLPILHAFVVIVGYYEGSDVLLIDDRTGHQTTLDSVPIFSPDGRSFLTIDDDVAYGNDPEFEIWSRRGDAAAVVWSGQADGLDLHYTSDVRWKNSDHIDLTMNAYGLTMDRPKATWPAALVRSRTGWRLEMNAPESAKIHDLH